MAVMHYYDSGQWKVPYFLYPKMWNGVEWVYVKPSIWGGDRWTVNVSNTLNPVNWLDISGVAVGTIYSNFDQTFSGIGTSINVSATKSTNVTLYYSQNNGPMTFYTIPLTLFNNDTLRWGVSSTVPISGIITIRNSFTSSTLDTFSYNLVSKAEGPTLPPPPPPPPPITIRDANLL